MTPDGEKLNCVGPALQMSGDMRESKANARLIAAAPDLLEALEEAVSDIRSLMIASGHTRRGADEFTQTFVDTIKKAKGGAE